MSSKRSCRLRPKSESPVIMSGKDKNDKLSPKKTNLCRSHTYNPHESTNKLNIQATVQPNIKRAWSWEELDADSLGNTRKRKTSDENLNENKMKGQYFSKPANDSY